METFFFKKKIHELYRLVTPNTFFFLVYFYIIDLTRSRIINCWYSTDIYLHIPQTNVNFIFSDNVWTVLTGQPTDQTSSIVLHDVKEIETWILRLLSAPVPIPGSTRIEVEVLSPTVHEPLLFALPDHTRFSLVDFPLHLPLELLGITLSHYETISTWILCLTKGFSIYNFLPLCLR